MCIRDRDGDGLNDGEELDTTQTDPLLADSDTDGLGDGDEVNQFSTNPNNADTDGGGIPDGVEVQDGTNPLEAGDDVVDLDEDNDGIPNAIEGDFDQDADGIPDYKDLDSDNDGIADILEAGGTDANGDGKVDNLLDANGDGLDDAIAAVPLETADTDLDGLADFLDIDSDQDGLPDLIEAGGIDANNDGMIDNSQDTNGDGRADVLTSAPLPILDTDNDGTPNYLDLDSDDDGATDLSESGGVDEDADGVVLSLIHI